MIRLLNNLFKAPPPIELLVAIVVLGLLFGHFDVVPMTAKALYLVAWVMVLPSLLDAAIQAMLATIGIIW